MAAKIPNKNLQLVARILAGRAFLVKTPICITYFQNLLGWLATGCLGAVVYGRPRLGKTSATRWVLNAMQLAVAKVPWIEIPVRKQHLAHEGAFFQFMLLCARNKYARKGTIADKRDRLLEALIRRAKRSPLRTVILFIDEAQQLDVLHYYWLSNISNELEMAGCRLFCLLVGQHQLSVRRETFILEGFEEIVGRFMTEQWSFSGLISSEALGMVLHEFDDALYPKTDGIPFPAHFIPVAFDGGLRLEHAKDLLWQEFMSRWTATRNNEPLVIPMQYASSSIANLLNAASLEDRTSLVWDSPKVSAAVEKSGFAHAIRALKRIQKAPAETVLKRKSRKNSDPE